MCIQLMPSASGSVALLRLLHALWAACLLVRLSSLLTLYGMMWSTTKLSGSPCGSV